MIAHPEVFAGRNVGLVICGGNIDAHAGAGVDAGFVRERRIATPRIEIADQPSVLAAVPRLIGSTGANIVEVHHQRMFLDLPVKRADINVSLETRNSAHFGEIISQLEQAGFPARRLSSHSTGG